MIKLFKTSFFLIFFSINAFGQDTTYFDSEWKETNKNNCKFYRVDKKENDKWLRTDYYKEGNQIQMKGYVTSINPEIKTGYFEWYFSNGELKHKGNYSDDKEIGEHLWYSDNGNLEAVENYKNGKLDGEYKEYHKSTGKISNETSFSNGLQNGYTKYYREDGSLHSEGEFKNGDRFGNWKYYDNSGNIIGTNDFKTEYLIPEAKLFLKLPNSNWSLTDKTDGDLTQYIFKREAISDSKGREIIPAIMIYIDDASKYKQDVTLFAVWKQKPFIEKGIKIDKILTQNDKDYPLTYKNSYFYKCHYSDKDFDHILYMIYIINADNKGIQIYMDMTKDIAIDYEQELLNTVNSIKEEK